MSSALSWTNSTAGSMLHGQRGGTSIQKQLLVLPLLSPLRLTIRKIWARQGSAASGYDVVTCEACQD